MDKLKELLKYSNPEEAQEQAFQKYGKNLYPTYSSL